MPLKIMFVDKEPSDLRRLERLFGLDYQVIGAGSGILVPTTIGRTVVTYVIAQPCVDLKDKACIEECPVDCIYEGERSLYIHPDECVDCGACEPVCPVEAIFYEDDTPAQWKDYYRANVDFFTETTSIGSPGGASKVGPVDLDHPVVMAVPLGKNTEGH